MFLDKNLLAPPASYIPVNLEQKYRTAILKWEGLLAAYHYGLDGITLEMVEAAEAEASQILIEICENYSREAVRNGSIHNRYDLPQFFRNATGTETPGDVTVIEAMAAARGQSPESTHPEYQEQHRGHIQQP